MLGRLHDRVHDRGFVTGLARQTREQRQIPIRLACGPWSRELAAEEGQLVDNDQVMEPDTEELLMAYETQKNVIQQLQASLAQERERATSLEKEMR